MFFKRYDFFFQTFSLQYAVSKSVFDVSRLCIFKVSNSNAGSECHCGNAQQYHYGGLSFNTY